MGWVRVEGGNPIPIQTGIAAFWEAGESHESGSEQGMSVTIIESKQLDLGLLQAHNEER
jgi:hypothetical protein